MKEFNELVNIVESLLGPEGCPWDRKQTLASVRRHLIEEAYEVIEAINEEDNENIAEELGDLFFNAVFLCKLGEKEQRLTTEKVLKGIIAKLIRRHPHVFEDKQNLNAEQVVLQWNKIKQAEKKKPQSPLDAIPKHIPTLLKAQKIIKTLKKGEIDYELPHSDNPEIELGNRLLQLVEQAERQKIDIDIALRKSLQELKQK